MREIGLLSAVLSLGVGVACTLAVPTPGGETEDAGSVADAGKPDANVDAATDANAALDANVAVDATNAETGVIVVPPVGADPLPKGVGWHRLSGTSLLGSGACAPNVGQLANEGCSAVIDDWNSAVYDSVHRRIVFTGGGHNGYFGNEVYALDLTTGPNGKTIRLNDPTPNPTSSSPWGGDPCQLPSTYYDGRPNQVHTYGGLVYVPTRDILWMQGGSGSPCGFAILNTWQLNLANLPSLGYPGATQWKRLAQTGLAPGKTFGSSGDGVGHVAVYDPVGDRIYVHTQYELDRYDFGTDSFTKLIDFNTASAAYIGLGKQAALDPKRQLMVMVGRGGVTVVSLANGSSYAHESWNVGSACAAWLSAESPGAVYDPKADKIVGVTGRSNVVYTLDTATKSCTAQTFAGDAVAVPTYDNGVFGRFQYADYLDAFVLINDPNEDALVLRTR